MGRTGIVRNRSGCGQSQYISIDSSKMKIKRVKKGVKKFFCIVSFVFIIELTAYPQSIAKDVYEFPVKPGSEEWMQFETVAKRFAALQIPNMQIIKL